MCFFSITLRFALDGFEIQVQFFVFSRTLIQRSGFVRVLTEGVKVQILLPQEARGSASHTHHLP